MPIPNSAKLRHLYQLSAGLFLLFVISAGSATAQAPAVDPVANDFLNVYNYTTDKATQLADAIPADKYDWRPAEGIRSIREAVLHLTSANYFFGSMLSAQTPDGINPQEMEQSGMSKKEAIAALKESVAFIQDVLSNMESTQFEEKIDFFGNKVTSGRQCSCLAITPPNTWGSSSLMDA